jgi:transposase InsO family protein
LTLWGRQQLVRRIASGRPIAHVAAEMAISRQTASKWWHRWLEHGDAGLVDRSSRPLRCPHRTPQRVEVRIERLRRSRKLGPARIGPLVGVPASTVHRVLVRRQLNRLRWLDRPTGEPLRRYELDRPGELVHVDIKKLGRIPAGGGWRALGRGNDGHGGHSGVGYAYLHAAVDDHSRLAYVEVLTDERGVTAAEFWTRAARWFRAHGIAVERVMTDNGSPYRSRAFAGALLATGATHTFIRPRRPQTNGKVERFNRTLLEEWAYVRAYRSEAARTVALDRWLHTYNHHRGHTALGGQPPVSRVNDLPRQHI